MEAIEMDSDTKQMIKEISAAFGGNMETVKEVWEYTIFTMLLKIAENPDRAQRICIPFLGHIRLKDNGFIQNADGETERDISIMASLSENFKDLYFKVLKGDFSELSEYADKRYTRELVKDIK